MKDITDSRIIKLAFDKNVQSMTPEEHIERNIYMRHKLKGTTHENATDEELDHARLKMIAQGLYYEFENEVVRLGHNETWADERRRRAAIPAIYEGMGAQDFDFDIYGKDMAMAKVKAIVNGFILKFSLWQREGKNLYIYSKTKGTGKTMLSCILLNEVTMRHMTPARFITVYDYLNTVTESWKDKTGDTSARLRDIETTQLLILDDIGAQDPNKLVNDSLFKLIDRRYSNMLVTIFTSNKKINDLGLDDRIISRIEEKSILVSLPEVSIRQRKAQSKQEEFLSRLEED
ncbi:ATP-binding protein [Coprococcus sp. AF19-8AC]|uniref:ATP-binding protein n=1 Tax=Coprococcus sp. AF19-8AC TaxID=2293090 RepID=UPI000E764289|nr:ATP-binding protein [Coprococcus sp. AF19-8AC]RJV44258.1 ATP-binding protein [Coprococcus sp. AF19-8AC]